MFHLPGGVENSRARWRRRVGTHPSPGCLNSASRPSGRPWLLAPGQAGEVRLPGLPLRERRVGLCRGHRLGLDAGSALERELRARIDDLQLAAPRAGHEDHAPPVPGTDERVLRPRRAVHEIPRAERPLLALDQEQALAGEDEEVLLTRLAVVARGRLARLEHADRVPELRERDRAALEDAAGAERLVRDPRRVPDVDDEPAPGGRREPSAGVLEPRLRAHPSSRAGSNRSRSGASRPRIAFPTSSPHMNPSTMPCPEYPPETHSRSSPGTRPTTGMKSGTKPNSPAHRCVVTTGQPTRSHTSCSSDAWIAAVVSSLVVNSSSSAVSRKPPARMRPSSRCCQ